MSVAKIRRPAPVGPLMFVTRVENHVGAFGQDPCTLWRIGYPMRFLFLDTSYSCFERCPLCRSLEIQRTTYETCLYSISAWRMNPTHCKFKTRSSEKNQWVYSVLQKHLGRAGHLRNLGLIPERSKRFISSVKCLDRLWLYWRSPSPRELKIIWFSFLNAFAVTLLFFSMNCSLDYENRKRKRVYQFRSTYFLGATIHDAGQTFVC
jgi:hypothetical protein